MKRIYNGSVYRELSQDIGGSNGLGFLQQNGKGEKEITIVVAIIRTMVGAMNQGCHRRMGNGKGKITMLVTIHPFLPLPLPDHHHCQ